MLLNNLKEETIVNKQTLSRRLASLLTAPLVGIALMFSLSFGVAAQPAMFWSEDSNCGTPITATDPLKLPITGEGVVAASLCANSFAPNTYVCDFNVKFVSDVAGSGLFAVTNVVRNSALDDGMTATLPWRVFETMAAGPGLGGGSTVWNTPVDPGLIGGTILLATYSFSVEAAAGAGPYSIMTTTQPPFGYPTGMGITAVNGNCAVAIDTHVAAAELWLEREAAPTYDVGFTTSSVGPENGVTATGTFAPANPQDGGETITVTITLTGAATAAGTHTVGLTSGTVAITSPAAVSKVVTVGEAMVAPNTFDFTFTMPASDVTDLVVTHTFSVAPPPTYNIVIATNGVLANGVTATGVIAPASPQEAGTGITVTITLAGTATETGTHTVGLTSATVAAITPPATVTRTVTAGGAVGAPNTFAFTFNMPAGNVTDLVVTNGFVMTPIIALTSSVAPSTNFGSATVGYAAITPRTVTVTNTGNTASGVLTVSMVGAGFDITNNNVEGVALAAAGGSNTFAIAPLSGLGLGSHSALITVSDPTTGSSTSFTVNFNVTPTPLSSTASIPVLGPVGLVLLALALGGLAFRQRRRV
jgi:hypothetical protein